MLSRFAQIDRDGHYQSPIQSSARRFFTMLGTLVGGRICVGSAAVSAGRTSLAIAIRYAAVRRQFGNVETEPERALLEYPSHQRRLLPHLSASVVLRTAFETVRNSHVKAHGEAGIQEPNTRRLEAEVAILKVLGSRHGVDATQACREACGGQGYRSVNRIADIRKDVEVFTTFEGDNIVLSQLVAKSLLSDYRHQFQDESPFAIARMVGKRALGRAAERNPVSSRLRDERHLRSREFQKAALSFRELRLTETLAARIGKRLKEGKDLDRAFLEVQEHALAAANAFGERLAFESFCNAEEEYTTRPDKTALSEQTKVSLTLLGDVYALDRLHAHAAWYLEDGYFEQRKSRAIRVQLEGALSQLSPLARAVVDAFGIPDDCLAAPIAFFDPAHPNYR
jgi:acyl-CoA oxidase